jgi:DNA topoisomerase-6 subunit A
VAKKKTVRKNTRKKTSARSTSAAAPSPAVVAKKMKKLCKKPAKKATRRAGAGGDAGVGKAILKESGRLAKQALAAKDPQFTIPVRANSNTEWDEAARILRMGDRTQIRELFNLGQARKFMQTTLQQRGVLDLLEQDKTLSLRGMYYKGLHTIAGTKEKTFGDQDESDTVLQDLEVLLGALREELHVFAKKRGTMVGNITVRDAGDEIDCRRMGTGGYAIPSICEPDVIEFVKCEADFVLHVEKDTVWSRFNEDRFWEKHNCILTEGSGQPPRGVRRLLQRLNAELGLPVICLLDCDPWGHYIYSVIKQGSMSLAFESERLAVPEAKFLGIRADDYERCGLSDDVKIALDDKDIKRAKEIMAYPWFADRRPWKKEIERMLRNGFKMEVESLITKEISYVTETYVPERLASGDFLD